MILTLIREGWKVREGRIERKGGRGEKGGESGEKGGEKEMAELRHKVCNRQYIIYLRHLSGGKTHVTQSRYVTFS